MTPDEEEEVLSCGSSDNLNAQEEEVFQQCQEATALSGKLVVKTAVWLHRQVMKQPWSANVRQAVFKEVMAKSAEFADGWDLVNFEDE